jgi:hypothetical protein
MKLIKLNGRIWELSTLQNDKYAADETSLDEANIYAIKGISWHRNIVRPLANHNVRSKATAIIETSVNGLPQQIEYEIYHNSKGFFCNVQGQRVFLEDLLEPDII